MPPQGGSVCEHSLVSDFEVSSEPFVEFKIYYKSRCESVWYSASKPADEHNLQRCLKSLVSFRTLLSSRGWQRSLPTRLRLARALRAGTVKIPVLHIALPSRVFARPVQHRDRPTPDHSILREIPAAQLLPDPLEPTGTPACDQLLCQSPVSPVLPHPRPFRCSRDRQTKATRSMHLGLPWPFLAAVSRKRERPRLAIRRVMLTWTSAGKPASERRSRSLEVGRLLPHSPRLLHLQLRACIWMGLPLPSGTTSLLANILSRRIRAHRGMQLAQAPALSRRLKVALQI